MRADEWLQIDYDGFVVRKRQRKRKSGILEALKFHCLLQRIDLVKAMTIPHLDELLLVKLRPFPNELPASFRQPTIDDVEVFKLHYYHVLAVLYVDVSRWMLAVD